MYAHRQRVLNRFFKMMFLDEATLIPGPRTECEGNLSEARMLQALYFPELRVELLKVLETDKVLDDFVVAHKFARPENREEWQKGNQQKYLGAAGNYEVARQILTEKCRQLPA